MWTGGGTQVPGVMSIRQAPVWSGRMPDAWWPLPFLGSDHDLSSLVVISCGVGAGGVVSALPRGFGRATPALRHGRTRGTAVVKKGVLRLDPKRPRAYVPTATAGQEAGFIVDDAGPEAAI